MLHYTKYAMPCHAIPHHTLLYYTMLTWPGPAPPLKPQPLEDIVQDWQGKMQGEVPGDVAKSQQNLLADLANITVESSEREL